ncbi:NYN domain-containing protein [Streptomyces kroppenstedtii]|uniref:NYN domain-containing protein n=1 Tax=Streptomyces kroppenstedtii TaxID=3051181 RepID=UPI0028D88AE2|nr:NYN domain-containing protein [Streptomyces sp. DSM 40484]
MGRTAVLVDGFNLYHGMKKQRGRRYLWLDHVKLGSRLRQRDQIVDVRYFTAPVLDDAAAASRQQTYLEALKAHNPGVLTVVEGRYQRKRMRCHACNTHRISYEEKETDVNIAVALMEIAALPTVDPVGGWWKTNKRANRIGLPVSYALLVSLETPDISTDLYSPIATQLGVPIEVTPSVETEATDGIPIQMGFDW